jgi:hypothetical protein
VTGVHPLIEEATKKAAVAWLTVPGHRPYAVWCLRIEDALYVVCGPGEQPAPGLAEAVAAEVTLRGDHGGRIITWPAEVSRLDPTDARWPTVVPALAGKRLNARGTAEDVAARWAADCTVSRLTPAGDPVESGPTLPDDSGAAPPPPSPATRRTANPFRLHRVRRPR